MTPEALKFHLAHVDPNGEMAEAERLKAAEARHRQFANNGRIGGLESWGRTPNRSARTKPGHSRSPGSLDYHLAAVIADDPENLMSEEVRLKAAKARLKAHMLRLAQASAQARRSKATPRKSA